MESFLPRSNPIPSSNTPKLEIAYSPHFVSWLQTQLLSLAFTTYQTNRLFFIGCNSQGLVVAKEQLFDKPMGMYASNSRLCFSTHDQIWRFDNLLTRGEIYQRSVDAFAERVALSLLLVQLLVEKWLVVKHRLYIPPQYTPLAT
ncbi:MAG: TIGR03032 family protein [Desmonostoc vinosum HA7617-LM4]|jgi:hypothetical protein|nr:TIGR03032 family protein [Desmonostoc vinosum HA7617-LM4]